ncbi:MAG: deoxyribodipyrimidine photo-lyase, partial [Pseudomonadota bacterium]
MTTTPTLLWLRRDLRLGDHPALDAARARGGPVIPLFILDDAADLEGGAAARWRLSRSLEALARALEGIGGRLILRRGPSASVLDQVIGETGAGAVIWSRRYEPEARARDAEIKADLRGRGFDADSRAGMLLREPHEVRAKTGGFYKVYTPYSRASMAMADPGEPLPAPERWPAPARWPRSETLAALGLETGAAR